jgi:hypothetical protein
MGPYGPKKVMCSITIDGDTVNQRNLWLSSVTPVPVVEVKVIFNLGRRTGPGPIATETVLDEIRHLGTWSVPEKNDHEKNEPAVTMKRSDLEHRSIGGGYDSKVHY